jgi:hypothetical protein
VQQASGGSLRAQRRWVVASAWSHLALTRYNRACEAQKSTSQIEEKGESYQQHVQTTTGEQPPPINPPLDRSPTRYNMMQLLALYRCAAGTNPFHALHAYLCNSYNALCRLETKAKLQIEDW